MYRFVYECLDRQAENYLDDFEIEFEQKEGHVYPFEIYIFSAGKNTTTKVIMQKVDDEALVELREADTIVVKINN